MPSSKVNESAPLSHPAVLAAGTQISRQIREPAPILNGPATPDATSVVSRSADVPVASMAKRHEGATYLFAVAMREGQTQARFTIVGMTGDRAVEVLGESRTLTARDGAFQDEFQPWDVHLYRIAQAD